MHTTSDSRRTTRRDSDPDLPPDFDPTEHPILSRHWFGIDPDELRDVRETWWDLARQGYPPVPEKDVILIEGGRRG